VRDARRRETRNQADCVLTIQMELAERSVQCSRPWRRFASTASLAFNEKTIFDRLLISFSAETQAAISLSRRSCRRISRSISARSKAVSFEPGFRKADEAIMPRCAMMCLRTARPMPFCCS
jgi:hypothetical protein